MATIMAKLEKLILMLIAVMVIAEIFKMACVPMEVITEKNVHMHIVTASILKSALISNVLTTLAVAVR